MEENDFQENEEIFSKALRAGRRTYFFDVRTTKAGDYYLTITESKKFSQDSGVNEYKKHKIYLYKEDFVAFRDFLDESTEFILKEKGEEVISERHVKDFKKSPYYHDNYEHADEITDAPHDEDETEEKKFVDDENALSSRFTNIEFEDI